MLSREFFVLIGIRIFKNVLMRAQILVCTIFCAGVADPHNLYAAPAAEKN
jgi:hypothetical protein